MSPSNRRDRRVVAALQVHVDDDVNAYFTKNLNVGGIFLITSRRFPVGSHLGLRLDYKGLVIEVGGRVTHLQRDGVGVRFWNPTREVQEAMGRVIRDLIASGHNPDDRRREPRMAIEETAVLWRRGELEHRGQLVNLSMSGARIRVARDAVRGETILLQLPTPAAEHASKEIVLVGCEAIVRQVSAGDHGTELGLEFDSPSAEFRFAVAKLLQSVGASGTSSV